MKTRSILLAFGLVAFGVAALGVPACGGGGDGSTDGTSRAAPPPPSAFSQTDLVQGTGTEAAKGARATVKYTGWIYDASKPENKGPKFDSSDDHDPLTFTIGAGEVIPGWDQGFNGMRIGGKRRLIIPPTLGYGAEGTPGGPIPPNAGLVFEMELVDLK